jgi:hypothetical protein
MALQPSSPADLKPVGGPALAGNSRRIDRDLPGAPLIEAAALVIRGEPRRSRAREQLLLQPPRPDVEAVCLIKAANGRTGHRASALANVLFNFRGAGFGAQLGRALLKHLRRNIGTAEPLHAADAVERCILIAWAGGEQRIICGDRLPVLVGPEQRQRVASLSLEPLVVAQVPSEDFPQQRNRGIRSTGIDQLVRELTQNGPAFVRMRL